MGDEIKIIVRVMRVKEREGMKGDMVAGRRREAKGRRKGGKGREEEPEGEDAENHAQFSHSELCGLSQDSEPSYKWRPPTKDLVTLLYPAVSY